MSGWQVVAFVVALLAVTKGADWLEAWWRSRR